MTTELPFDASRLDGLMEEAGLDLLIVSSKHNIQYLLGGYRFFFFEDMDAIGLSRYLPILIYPRGKPEHAAYLANAMESRTPARGTIWPPTVHCSHWGTIDTLESAITHMRSLSTNPGRIGIESGFLPADAYQRLRDAFPDKPLLDAVIPLERLRAVKTSQEIEFLRKASEGVVGSMMAAAASQPSGVTKHEILEAVRREETNRGLNFEYCLITLGNSLNRAPSDEIWEDGQIISLDSGGNFRGYIGDLCRMGMRGEPDNQLVEFLDQIEMIQQAARRPIRPGALGRDIIEAGEAARAEMDIGHQMDFVAHGMGLISHEAPRLMSNGPVPYPGDDAGRPLESGMVLSIETTLAHQERGFIKLEDTVIVTSNGWEALGDTARGWNQV